jgi:hypothetical protein
MEYLANISISLIPHGVPPIIRYGIDSINREIILNKPEVLSFCVTGRPGPRKIVIAMNNKTDETPDMAVEISSVTIEGLTLDRFKWSSRYYPIYPEPWASQQKDPLPEFQTSATYLGWNGIWYLGFELPIFQWIHNIENLGWIYE